MPISTSDLEYQCVKCETYFFPIESPITICPECGEPNLQPDEFQEIIKVILEAIKSYFKSSGKFGAPFREDVSMVEFYQIYAGELLDLYCERQTPRDILIEEDIAGESSAWKEHLRKMLIQIFDEAKRQNLFGEQPVEKQPAK